MIIHSLIRRGFSHKEFCEDFLAIHQNNQYFIGAVFDGCSSGQDSHFCSVLFAKILNQYILKLQSSEISSTNLFLKEILYKFILKLKETKVLLNLTIDELLATIVMMVIDKSNYSSTIICIGDGFISINGSHIDIDQNNQPDYLAYHLHELIDKEYFDKWYNKFENKFHIDKLIDVTISTDGIGSFEQDKALIGNNVKVEEIDVKNYIAKDNFLIQNGSMLARKCNILKNKHGLVNFDDLGIIRVIVTSQK